MIVFPELKGLKWGQSCITVQQSHTNAALDYGGMIMKP
jgi:hypothetical protein